MESRAVAAGTKSQGYLSPLRSEFQASRSGRKIKECCLAMNSLCRSIPSRKRLLLPLLQSHHSTTTTTTTAAKPTKPKTPNTYTITTPRFTPKSPPLGPPPKAEFPRPSEVPFQPKVANCVRLIGHVRTPFQVHTTPDGTFWASTVLTTPSSSQSLRIPIIFEGDLAHTASLHVKDSDFVFISGNLRSDLNHVNASGGETHLQVMVRTLNFVEKSFPIYKTSKDGTEDRTVDHTALFLGFLLTICLACGSIALFEFQQWYWAVAGEKDDMNESLKDVLVWKDLLARPHEWWDVRSKEGSPKAAAFERKSNGELRMIDDSTPEWIQHKLDSLTFDQKPISYSPETSLKKDGDSTLGTWRDLLDNPKQWNDYRDQKLNGLVKQKHPDFKRKDGGHSLWFNKAPQWVLSEVEGKKFDVQIQKSKQANEGRGDKSWKDLVEKPEKWWDNRLSKRNEKAPDFKHKETGEALWLNSSPGWVLPMLPPLTTQKNATSDDRETPLP